MSILEIVKKRVSVFGELCYLTFAGSITYGLNTSESDVDFQGFFIPYLDYLIGIKRVEQVQIKINEKIEGTVFEIRKLFNLLKNVNPNVLEMLWVREQDILFKNDIAEKVIQNRKLFLSKRIKHTFGGYAFAQFQRMKALNRNVNQNKKRLERVEKFGYDTKNAMHLFRLLSMGYEALIEERINVFRSDRDFLKQVRDGFYSYNQIIGMANEKFHLIENAYIHSKLPHSVDEEKINKLLKEIIIQKIKEEL